MGLWPYDDIFKQKSNPNLLIIIKQHLKKQRQANQISFFLFEYFVSIKADSQGFLSGPDVSRVERESYIIIRNGQANCLGGLN